MRSFAHPVTTAAILPQLSLRELLGKRFKTTANNFVFKNYSIC